MSVANQKSELRSQVLSKRQSLDDEVWHRKSDLITNSLKEFINKNDYHIIHSYVSMNNRKEVDTHPFIRECLLLGKKVIISKSNLVDYSLSHYQIFDLNSLKENHWGVLEPDLEKETDLTPEIIIVPLVAADKSFNRLGFGKGFYDRYLKSSSAIKVGLVFEEFILTKFPVEETDVPLDILISEKNIYFRNKNEH